ncbi:transcriptional regulator [Pedobacter endophyticus]|uniref:Transcriptional regulator n=1 Tax=Pedobacter endophyticus TaxID=2789740 RepID=A0A7S9Q125_9SPHI|nr:transcriptional regulator [Pedobacter endophyticus]QPH41332.1 transcriptional regulator [Pedobacter endophyticus]
MEKYTLHNNITLLCETATSFPDGVLAAHQKLHRLFPPGQNRRYFGISRRNGQREIIYKAAVEKISNDDTQGLAVLIIEAGEFVSELISDFRNDVSQIGQCFQRLLQQPDIDPNGYCLEVYINENDVRCMVGIKN